MVFFESMNKETSLQIQDQKRKPGATSKLNTSLHRKSKLSGIWQDSVKIILESTEITEV